MLILMFDLNWGHPLGHDVSVEGVEVTLDRARYDAADVVVFHLPEWKENRIRAVRPWAWDVLPRKRPGQIWVGCSIECEDHYPVMRDARLLQHLDVSMTYRLDSDVPTTYAIPFGSVEAMVAAFRRPPPDKTQDALLAAFISSEVDRDSRRAYLFELSKYMRVDSYGRFMNNRRMEHDGGRQSKLDTISGYKFVVAFENARSPDYVTEKLYDAFWAGTVPVYFGAPNVERFVPGDGCYIDAARFPDPKDLAAHLERIAGDDAAYRGFFAWKEQPFRERFTALVEREARRPMDRLCDFLLARR